MLHLLKNIFTRLLGELKPETINNYRNKKPELLSVENLKLIPQNKFNSKAKETVIIQNIDTDYIEKTLSNLIRSMENFRR